MININNVEKLVTEELEDGEHFSLRKEGWIELITRLREAEKDAARYRWLSSRAWFQDEAEYHLGMHVTETEEEFYLCASGKIDQAMKERGDDVLW